MVKNVDFSLYTLSLIPLAYIIKGALPFDLTLFLYILLYAISIYRLLVKKEGFKTSKIDILFYLWVLIMSVGVVYSPYMFPALFKLSKFVFLALSLVFFTRLFIKKLNDIYRLLNYLLVNSVLTGYIVLLDFFNSGLDTNRYQAFGEVIPIPLALLGSATLLISIFMYYFKVINLGYFLVSAFPSVSLLAIAGSKGPVVSLIVTLLFMLPLFFKKLNFKFAAISFISILFITRINFVSNALESLTKRFTATESDLSTVIRLDIYEDSILYFEENPLFGKGTYAAYPDYPHNFFLEILSENGIILFLVVSILLILFAYRYVSFIIKQSNSYLETIIISLIILSIASLMFSFTYIDHKYLFLSVGLLIIYEKLKAGEYSQEKIKLTNINNDPPQSCLAKNSTR